MCSPTNSLMRPLRDTMDYEVRFDFTSEEEGDRLVAFLRESHIPHEYDRECLYLVAALPNLGHEDPTFTSYSQPEDIHPKCNCYLTPEQAEHMLSLYPENWFWCYGIYNGFHYDCQVGRASGKLSAFEA